MKKLTGTIARQGSIAYVAQQAWIQNLSFRDNVLFGEVLYFCKPPVFGQKPQEPPRTSKNHLIYYQFMRNKLKFSQIFLKLTCSTPCLASGVPLRRGFCVETWFLDFHPQ